MARQAISAGVKNVLIEKPLAVTSEGVKELHREASEKQAKVGVAYVYRAHPAVAAMRKAIASGRFGKPVQLSVVSGQHFPFYRPAYASTYYTRHETGGGAIQDGLTHLFNLGQWLVGPVTRIAALAHHRVLAHVDVEDTVNVLAEHGDVMASYSTNQHQAVNESTVLVACTQGVCRFQVHRHAWSWATEPDSPWNDHPENFATRDDWFIRQCENWLDVVAGKRQPDCTLDEGAATLKVNQAALHSAQNRGQWMEIA
jgi:predicted dehydrogenase